MFNTNKFMKENLAPKTEKIEVQNLSEFFSKDETPEFEVRALTGSELIRTNEAAETNKNLSAIVQALATGTQQGKTEALKELAGVSDDVPAELARRIEILMFGCVKPEVDRQFAVKMAEFYPADFVIITNRIRVLTAQGADMVKPKPSGKTAK